MLVSIVLIILMKFKQLVLRDFFRKFIYKFLSKFVSGKSFFDSFQIFFENLIGSFYDNSTGNSIRHLFGNSQDNNVRNFSKLLTQYSLEISLPYFLEIYKYPIGIAGGTFQTNLKRNCDFKKIKVFENGIVISIS